MFTRLNLRNKEPDIKSNISDVDDNVKKIKKNSKLNDDIAGSLKLRAP